MIGYAFRKVAWLGRAAMFCVGLAVVLAVVLGTAATALAAVPGDPFKLGRLNAVDRMTTLAGSVAGPLLRVQNNGGGPALALDAGAGRPPLTVGADAGKATNLDADELDGKDASAFLPADGKAASAATADTAADAEQVDGLDSSRFMRSATYYHHKTSPLSSDATQTVTASCPSGPRPFMAISGGASVVAPDAADATKLGELPVALKVDRPEGRSSWVATASETSPYEGEWAVKAYAICVQQTTAWIYPADGE